MLIDMGVATTDTDSPPQPEILLFDADRVCYFALYRRCWGRGSRTKKHPMYLASLS
jgi:hypothetical protein